MNLLMSNDQIIINGKPYTPADYSINMHSCTYRISAHERNSAAPLLDRGSNGGVIHMHPHMKVNIEGIDRHQITDIPLATIGGVVNSSVGPVVIVLPFYALIGKGATIMCPGQFEYYRQRVDDKSAVIGGTQSITTPNGVVIPVGIVNGLAHIPIRRFTDHKFDKLPMIFLADDSKPWDPSVLNSTSSSLRKPEIPGFPTSRSSVEDKRVSKS